MFGIIFNATCGMIFMVLSLSAGAGLVFHGDQYTQGQLWNMAGLSIALAFAWVWAFKNAGEAWYIWKSK
ncbi:hypothetical protein I5W62_004848 [Salmonella enterica]|uniref:Uncharacterized protein n=1 Tax=Salmonella enterica TaxID=28901 RepID=A0A5U3BYI3_SALER|nr:hypothetical protein [Salmonella enterica]EBS4770573.1 hypothetical protein [Salmonella enterica subsp. enterica serovar Sandiego]ECH8236530.1 hypothetical protein [Salmonella enterica subsp. enterica]EED8307029.1 hypothetical protein [Salmonella enterica subsp. houtenae]EAO9266502.1 hypothetical protein [Salmonella enterica]EAU1958546.1 hypothetical protein [Salmonella enterica]